MPKPVIAALFAVQAFAWTPAFAAGPDLAPYQMVRSLQIVQDRIANGDHAALPMQKKMIEMIDRRLLTAAPEEFSDRRNFEALLVYGMSGGNPVTVETIIADLELDEHDAALTEGLIAYFKSNPGKASSILSRLDPTKETPQIGAFLALVKGTISTLQWPDKSLQMLDLARLYAPGTLVEEAALRRSVSIATNIKDYGRFLTASEQYTRRFLHSPYASHFADGFIGGVVKLREGLDLREVEDIVSGMNAEQQLAIYLRIARQSAIAGYTDLAEFGSANAQKVSGNAHGPEDPRAAFYRALASITTDPVHEVADKLDALDRSTLSKRDLRLLDAAREVIRSVMASPLEGRDVPVAEAAADAVEATQPEEPGADDMANADADDLPIPREMAAERKSPPARDPGSALPADAVADTAAASPKGGNAVATPERADIIESARAPTTDADGENDEPSYDDVVSSTRKTLQDIDELLKKVEE